MAELNSTQNQGQGAAQAQTAQAPAPIQAQTEQINQQIKAGTEQGADKINREFQEKSVLKKAQDLGLPYVNIGKTPLNPDFLRLVDFEAAKKARLVTFFRLGKKLRVAVEDPNNPDAQAVIKTLQTNGYQITLNLASHPGIDEALKLYETQLQYKKPEIVEKVDTSSINTYEKEIAALSELSAKLDGLVAEEALNLLDISAIKTGASDVHYEPTETAIEVRFRIDGMLHRVFDIKPATYKNIANQIKYKSKMQLNITTIPQDGRYGFNFNEKKIDVRVSSIPTPTGESFVCRYLVPHSEFTDFEKLGFQGNALKKIQDTVKLSNGMVLCTGPTGSGKTTTLYSLLNKMTNKENKVITLEDPVEYLTPGVTHSQVNEKRGYDFANGLRAILRQDPDIIMVGEIRDLETAETAAQAALTGHVLLSTLHTNNAIEAIPRLINMGLPRYVVASSLDTIVAQRLVRKVCPDCSVTEDISDSVKQEFEQVYSALKNINKNLDLKIPDKVAQAKGCDKCSHTGYKGRIVLCEIIVLDETMKRLILNEKSSVDVIAQARKSGFITLREDGFMKIAQGITTVEEVHRVTNVSF
jgi:type IV pilus assembly protein PilB